MQRGGLSPRLRGDPTIVGHSSSGSGSIPAPAGEPRGPLPHLHKLRVYPRACGGTVANYHCQRADTGLSPRLRGNRCGAGEGLQGRGSIPAPAGEPRRTCPRRCHRRVYPRACGGTPRGVGSGCGCTGLSPRLRGNHEGVLRLAGSLRSIPAPAGEPDVREVPQFPQQVYPRACGGTMSVIYMTEVSVGLSPRLRGNPPPGC